MPNRFSVRQYLNSIYSAIKIQVKIEINRKSELNDSFILFVTMALKPSKESNCSGELLSITSDSPLYKDCSQSTFLPEKDCKAGLSGKGVDGVGSIWITDEESAGAWLEISLKEYICFITLGKWRCTLSSTRTETTCSTRSPSCCSSSPTIPSSSSRSRPHRSCSPTTFQSLSELPKSR